MRGRQSAATKSIRQQFVLNYFKHFGDTTYANVNGALAAAATDARFSVEEQAAFAKGAMGPKDLKRLRLRAVAQRLDDILGKVPDSGAVGDGVVVFDVQPEPENKVEADDSVLELE